MKIDYKLVGRRIREYRERENLTQEELAFAIKTSASYVSRIERAVKKPSLDKIVDIAEILGVTVNDPIYPPTAHNNISRKSSFIKRISQFSPDEQTLLFDKLDAIVNMVSTK